MVDFYGCFMELMIVIIFDELVDIYVFIVFFLNGDYVNDWLNIYVNIL